jgi:hypothetical protein
MANQTTYTDLVHVTGGTAGLSGSPSTLTLSAQAAHLLAVIVSACDTVFTTAESGGGGQVQIVSSSLGLADQRFLTGPYVSSGPATNSSGQGMVQDIIPFEEPAGLSGASLANTPISIDFGTAGDSVTTGQSAMVAMMYCQDRPPAYWLGQFPLPTFARGGYQVEAEQLTTTATNLAAIQIPAWAREIISSRSVVLKADAITTAEYEQAYFVLNSTIPNIAPLKLPTNSEGAALGTPVGTGQYNDAIPQIPIYVSVPQGNQTITPQVNLIHAVTTGNDVAFGVSWR